MSRTRSFVRYTVFFVLALVVVVVTSAAAPAQGVKDPKPTRAEYTVASTSGNTSSSEADTNAAADNAAGSRMVVAEQGPRMGPVPASVTLLIVGTMLIGLAAAVRRTT